LKLPKHALSHYQFTLIGIILLVFMGISSYLTMPRTEDPPVTIPGAGIIVIHPGTNPVDLEQLIADPIEKAVNELDDIKRIETKLMDGVASINVEFTFNTDADEKYNEVVRQVNSIQNELPENIYSINIQQWTSSDVSILQLAFVSDSLDYAIMEKEADQLKNEIEGVKGVRNVKLHACPEEEVRVSLDIEKMALMNIPIEQVADAIKSNNANIPGGSVKMGGRNFSIKSSAAYNHLDEIKNTVVGFKEGKIIYLKNIASINMDYEDQNYIAKFNSNKAIFLTVNQKEGFNIFDIWESLETIIEEYKKHLDEDIELKTVFNQSHSVDKRINGFMNNLVQGIILVGLVIFLSLGRRASLIVILAIPFSILIGLGFVDLTGFGLQQISIAALVISLGLLVDNSIVIVENIERFIRNGHNRYEAAIKATSQLGWPIVSATTTTLLAFIPIIMMPDKAGKFIQSLPVTVVFTLAASLLLALTFTPLMASYLLKAEEKFKKNKKEPINKLQRSLEAVIQGPYKKTLHKALLNKKLVIIIASIALGISVLIFFRFVAISFFPKTEKPQFMIKIITPEGSNINHTEKAAQYVEKILDTIPQIDFYATNIGHGNPRIYYNQFPKKYAQNQAEFFVQLKEYNYIEFKSLINSLRDELSTLPFARAEVKEFEQGPPIEAPLVIKITGTNNDMLKKIADSVELMVNQTLGVINIDNAVSKDKTDLYININKDKAGMLGVPVARINQTIRTCINGNNVSKFRDEDGNEYDIVLRLPFKDRIQMQDLKAIKVQSLSGRFIPLLQLAKIEFKRSPGVITHYNLNKSAAITGDIANGHTLDDVISQLKPQLDNYPWPRGYDYKFTGELESRRESFGGIGNAGVIALIAIFAVLVLQFRSFTQPLIVFTAIPLAVIGSVLALAITGYPFSFTAFIGLISLIGIVVNNSIILVDYTNQLLLEGKKLQESIIEAGQTRFTPILLTTLTTIGGLLPLTLQGGSLWAPMGWTIIGGLLVSTLLTLIVVPVLFSYLTKKE